jgi:hypothetical protein
MASEIQLQDQKKENDIDVGLLDNNKELVKQQPPLQLSQQPPLQLSPLLQSIKPKELNQLKNMKHLSRAPFELFCLLYVLIYDPFQSSITENVDSIEIESNNAASHHAACLACVIHSAKAYRSSSGIYDITMHQRVSLCRWSHVTTMASSFIETLHYFDSKNVTKDRIVLAQLILTRGTTQRSKRTIDFGTRIRNTLTPSHANLLTWCINIVNSKSSSIDVDLQKQHWYASSMEKEDRSKRKSSLAFNFLPTIPPIINYELSVKDITMVGKSDRGRGKRATIEMIKKLYRTHYPGKDVGLALENFIGREVVLLRRIQGAVDATMKEEE